MSELESHIEAILSEETVRERQVQRISEYVVSTYVTFEDASTEVALARRAEIAGVIRAVSLRPDRPLDALWAHLAQRRGDLNRRPEKDNNT